MSRYNNLRDHLRIRRGQTLSMAFDEIAELVDGLPPSAFEHREWWANDGTHVQAQAWMAAGWAVDSVDLPGRQVQFVVRDAQSTEPRSAARPRPGTKAAIYPGFWARLIAQRAASHPEWPGKPSPTDQSWISFPSPVPGTYLSSGFARGSRARSELAIEAGNATRNQKIYDALLRDRSRIEDGYGRPLSFEELPGRQMSRIADYLERADVRVVSTHDQLIDWLIDGEARFRRALE